jgi:PhnB protein
MALREGFHTVTPYLTTKNVDELVEFTKRAFGAVQLHRDAMGPGRFHVEIRIGDSMVMIGGSLDTTPVTGMLYLHVDNVDAAYKRALDAGASPVQEPKDTPDGHRRGGVRDEFGNLWFFGKPKT